MTVPLTPSPVRHGTFRRDSTTRTQSDPGGGKGNQKVESWFGKNETGVSHKGAPGCRESEVTFKSDRLTLHSWGHGRPSV